MDSIASQLIDIQERVTKALDALLCSGHSSVPSPELVSVATAPKVKGKKIKSFEDAMEKFRKTKAECKFMHFFNEYHPKGGMTIAFGPYKNGRRRFGMALCQDTDNYDRRLGRVNAIQRYLETKKYIECNKDEEFQGLLKLIREQYNIRESVWYYDRKDQKEIFNHVYRY